MITAGEYEYGDPKYFSTEGINWESFDASLYVRRDIATVFKDFQKRKAGIEKALSTDYETFLKKWSSGEEKLFFYGLPDGEWRVTPVADPYLPEPFGGFKPDLGIGSPLANFLNGLLEVSHKWLLSMADCRASKEGLDKVSRKILFGIIHAMPTVSDVVIKRWDEKDVLALERQYLGKLMPLSARAYYCSKYSVRYINLESVVYSLYVRQNIASVLEDFQKRKVGIGKALSTDYESFFEKYSSGDDDLYLYGLPNGEWTVTPVVDPDLPEPAGGFNKFLYVEELGMLLYDLSHCGQKWLLSVADSRASKDGLDQISRIILFDIIDDMQTVPALVQKTWDDKDLYAMERQDIGKYVTIKCEGCLGEEESALGWILCRNCELHFHAECIAMPIDRDKVVNSCPECTRAKRRPVR